MFHSYLGRMIRTSTFYCNCLSLSRPYQSHAFCLGHCPRYVSNMYVCATIIYAYLCAHLSILTKHRVSQMLHQMSCLAIFLDQKYLEHPRLRFCFSGWCEPPPTNCSFARHLVGKMVIQAAHLLITKHSPDFLGWENLKPLKK